jgi:hypothetical protein
MLDASLSRRMEAIRPASEQSPMWIARQIMALNAALDWLEARIQLLDGPDEHWPDRDRVCPWPSRPSLSRRAVARQAPRYRQVEHNVSGASVNDCDT